MTSRRRDDGIAVAGARPADRSLVPGERDVRTGRVVDVDREDKGRRPDREEPSRREVHDVAGAGRRLARGGRTGRWWVVVVVAGVLVLAGVALATGVLGGRGAGGTAAGGAASASAGVSAPELDPERITGYSVTLTRAAVEVAPDVDIPSDEVVGSVETDTWSCAAGVCIVDASAWLCAANGCADEPWVFDAATPEFDRTIVVDVDLGVSGETPCFPITVRLTITRADDGSYAGTLTQDPAQVSGESRSGDTITYCSAPRITDELALSPVVSTP